MVLCKIEMVLSIIEMVGQGRLCHPEGREFQQRHPISQPSQSMPVKNNKRIGPFINSTGILLINQPRDGMDMY